MIKFEKLAPGMTVYDVGRTRMGNTTMTTVSVWHVSIISVDPETRTVMASWNGNRPQRYYGHGMRSWRLAAPMLVRSGLGSRLATREEIKAAKLESKT